MELDGDEKRIQALFSELRFDDQCRVPQFGHIWTRAQARQEIGVRGVGRLVLLSLLVIAAACSLAVRRLRQDCRRIAGRWPPNAGFDFRIA